MTFAQVKHRMCYHKAVFTGRTGHNHSCIFEEGNPNAGEQHSTAQHSTAQHSTAQHSTSQHSTALCTPVYSSLVHNIEVCQHQWAARYNTWLLIKLTPKCFSPPCQHAFKAASLLLPATLQESEWRLLTLCLLRHPPDLHQHPCLALLLLDHRSLVSLLLLPGGDS